MLAADSRPSLLDRNTPNEDLGTLNIAGTVLSPPTISTQLPARHFHKNASIILIGVRGAGKRSLGFIAAAHLGRRFITEGLHFENRTGCTKAAYLNQHGKDTFHRRTLELFRELLEENSEGCVIECGMASLTSEAQGLLLQYSSTHPVIHILRDFDFISQYLRLETRQMEALKLADLGHRSCSNFEFYNVHDCTWLFEGLQTAGSNVTSALTLQDVKVDFQNFVNFVLLKSPNPNPDPFSLHAISPEEKTRSYATSINLSELLKEDVELQFLETGGDAVELCVDVWTDAVKPFVSREISILRRKLGVPIILSVIREGPDRSRISQDVYMDVMDQGIRSAVDYIAVEGSTPVDSQTRLLLSKGNTKAISDHYFSHPAPRAWLDSRRIAICEAAESRGYDLVRLRQDALEHQDNLDLQMFQHMASRSTNLPITAYNTGCYGKSSKIQNRILTPVERDPNPPHLRLEGSSGGAIFAREAVAALFHCFDYDSLRFYVLGQAVSFSCAPAIYTAAFQLYGMSHTFLSQDVSNFGDVLKLTQHILFGGAAISFPFKENAFVACSVRSAHAQVIESVNTILPLRQLMGEKTDSLFEQAKNRNRAGPVIGLYGDNTDWEGLYRNVKRKMSPRNAATCTQSNALVLGAGGSARSSIYALLHLGFRRVFVYNRTYAKACKVAEHFNSWVASRSQASPQQLVQVLKPGDLNWPPEASLPVVVIACVPTTTASFSGRTGEPFRLPEAWLGSPSGGVVVDYSYNPLNTPFLEQVRFLKQAEHIPWTIVTGVDLVYEQAILQFELMTGYRAPRVAMKKALEG